MTGTTLGPLGDANLEKLTRELNLLDRTRDDHLEQLGRALIPIRQLLQQMNGAAPGAKVGSDNLSPRGWRAWCQSAGLAQEMANRAVRRAVDPEGNRLKVCQSAKQENYRARTVTTRMKRAWPTWTMDERADFIATVRALATEANRAAA